MDRHRRVNLDLVLVGRDRNGRGADMGEDIACVALTRFPSQAAGIEELALPGCIVPRAAIDSRSLMYAADLVIGAGGTMTREAALMGVPTLTVFAGQPPAADRWLEERGSMARLGDVAQVRAIEPRHSEPAPVDALRERGERGIEAFVDGVTEAAARRRSAAA